MSDNLITDEQDWRRGYPGQSPVFRGWRLAFGRQAIEVTNLPSSIAPYLEPERQAQYGRKDLVQVANQVWDPQL